MPTIEDAATRIGVTVSAIRNATLEGRLPVVRLFGRKLITAGALAEYKVRPQVNEVPPRGRPKRLTPLAVSYGASVKSLV